MAINYTYLYEEIRNENKELIIKHLPKQWNIFIPKFIDEEIDFGRKVRQEYVFKDPIFSKTMTNEEITRIEEWLGHQFHLILRYNHNWYKKYSSQPKTLRKHYELLARMVIYYKNFFTENNIEFFSTDIDCRYPFAVGVLVAKRLGLKPMILGQGRVTRTMMIRNFEFKPIYWKTVADRDIESAKKFFSERYSRKDKKQENLAILEENKSRYSILNIVLGDIAKLYRKIFYKKKHKPMQYVPMHRIIEDQMTRQARRFIVPFLLERADLDSKYLFFPIHHDEETHLSWGEHFINQYDIMGKVAESLPVDTHLFIKPHPNWMCTDAPITEMRKLRKCRNIRIIPPKTNPLELIKNSKGVITINSTTGIEAIALGKPLMTFGHNEYARDGIAVCVHDLKNLPAAVEKIVYSPEKSFNQRERDLFLARFYKHLIPYEGVGKRRIIIHESGAKRIAEEMGRYVDYLKSKSTS